MTQVEQARSSSLGNYGEITPNQNRIEIYYRQKKAYLQGLALFILLTC